MAERILIIEDDPEIVEMIAVHIRDLGYELEHCENGTEGLERAFAGSYALLLLDLTLPGVGGMEICRRVREKDRRLPIIMITSRADEVDKVLGLEVGADDYLTKPFSPRELVARIRALLRRTAANISPDPQELATGAKARLDFPQLSIDPLRHKVICRGEEVALTAKEYDLLYFLASSPGVLFTKGQLLEQVWHYDVNGYEPVVTTYVSRLRHKLQDGEERFIKTIKGVGYKFAEREELLGR